MSKAAKLLLFILLCLATKAQAQKQLFSIDTPAKLIAIDPLRQLYIVTKDNSLLRYDSTGRLTLSQKFYIYGEIDFLDVRDPLQIGVFLTGQNRALILDNSFTIIHNLELTKSGVEAYSAGCRSQEGGIWIFDPTEAKIKRFAYSGEFLQRESIPLTALGLRDMNVTYLVENRLGLFLALPKVGILQFDNYGGYVRTISVKGVSRLSSFRESIFFLEGGKLIQYVPQTNELIPVTLPPLNEAPSEVVMEDRRMYVRFDGMKRRVHIFSY